MNPVVTTSPGSLQRILGLGFGLALAFGTMVGVGILRLPGVVASVADSTFLIILFWCIGAAYALMGAVSVSELAVMYPQVGGLRVYADRAFGGGAGFAVGWSDWLASSATLAFAAVTAVDFLGTIWPGLKGSQAIIAVGLILVFAFLHALGVRAGSSVTSFASAAIGVLLVVLMIACVLAQPVAQPADLAARAQGSRSGWSLAALLAMVPAWRAILTAFDGWYAPIYTAEESVNASRTLPRAIIGGALMVGVLYLLINLALLRVLPIPELAASKLPVADAARIVLPHGSAALITALSLLIVLGLINVQFILAPRVLFSLAREGWIASAMATVSRRGTPLPAVAVTAMAACLLILTGSFNQILALFAVLTAMNYCVVFLAVFELRRRHPETPRLYKALGYPFSASIALLGSVTFLGAAVVQDWRSGLTAVVFLSLCIPAYLWAGRARRRKARFLISSTP